MPTPASFTASTSIEDILAAITLEKLNMIEWLPLAGIVITGLKVKTVDAVMFGASTSTVPAGFPSRNAVSVKDWKISGWVMETVTELITCAVVVSVGV